MRRYRRKAALFPKTYQTSGLGRINSIRQFDDKIVARYCGFQNADDYYFRSSSARAANRIATPTLILHALDDPFVRLTPETHSTLLANPHIALIETHGGGHCAFLSNDAGDDIHWAESTVIRYLRQFAGDSHGS
jgi:hypothetical protein